MLFSDLSGYITPPSYLTTEGENSVWLNKTNFWSVCDDAAASADPGPCLRYIRGLMCTPTCDINGAFSSEYILGCPMVSKSAGGLTRSASGESVTMPQSQSIRIPASNMSGASCTHQHVRSALSTFWDAQW